MSRPTWMLVTRREVVALVLWGATRGLTELFADGTMLHMTAGFMALAATVWAAFVLWTAPDRPTWAIFHRKDDE